MQLEVSDIEISSIVGTKESKVANTGLIPKFHLDDWCTPLIIGLVPKVSLG